MKQIFRPLGKRIVVRPGKPEEKSAGGIFIPESAQSRFHKGEVVEVGILSQHEHWTDELIKAFALQAAGEDRTATDIGKELENFKLVNGMGEGISKGDRIMYAKESGVEIEVNGEKLIVLQEDNVMMIIETAVESIYID